MTTGINDQTLWVMNGDPDEANETYDQFKDRLGELGKSCTVNGVRRTRVRLDSGATSATPVGAVADGNTAFWRNQSTHPGVVTNDIRFADQANAPNTLAGIFTTPVTASNFTLISKKRRRYAVKVTGATWNAGDVAVVNDTTNAADVARVAAGTAPTYPYGFGLVGVVAVTGVVGGKVVLNIDIPDLP